MNVNVRFSGAVEKILEAAVNLGYASTKTEALRLGVFELNNRYNLVEDLADKRDIERADAIMARVLAGKEKVYSEAELMKLLK